MFGRLSDRFHWTPEQIAHLNSFQIESYLDYLAENPLPIVGAADPPKPGGRRRRRR